jgi:hypothetical protein
MCISPSFLCLLAHLQHIFLSLPSPLARHKFFISPVEHFLTEDTKNSTRQDH